MHRINQFASGLTKLKKGNNMWVRTISGWRFFKVAYTSQGLPYIIPGTGQ